MLHSTCHGFAVRGTSVQPSSIMFRLSQCHVGSMIHRTVSRCSGIKRTAVSSSPANKQLYRIALSLSHLLLGGDGLRLLGGKRSQLHPDHPLTKEASHKATHMDPSVSSHCLVVVKIPCCNQVGKQSLLVSMPSPLGHQKSSSDKRLPRKTHR